jgi:hypothetical protein
MGLAVDAEGLCSVRTGTSPTPLNRELSVVAAFAVTLCIAQAFGSAAFP